LNNPARFYYLSLLIVGISLWICWYFTKTPFGNIVMSIRSNEERTKFIGFNVGASKLVFLALLGFFAGVSGALYAQFQQFIATSTIDLGMSTNVLFMAYIGGTGSFLGPIIGSGFFVYLSEYLSGFTDRWEFIFGLIFVSIVLLAPQGISGIVLKRKQKG
jgi:branched-chain amino acid transport system permease protein